MKVWLALTLVSIVGIIILTGNYRIALVSMTSLPYHELDKYGLAVIPLFILMGHLVHNFGYSKDLFGTVQRYLSSLKGGLVMAVISGSAVFAATSGSGMASSAVMGKIALPEMVKSGYDKSLSAGAIAASGTLASLIPPSAHLIIYGYITYTDIGRLFIAAIIPGLLSVIIYFGYIYLWALKNPHKFPEAKPLKLEKLWVELKFVANSWAIVALIFFILGGIYFGIFTPNEAGAAGALAVIALAILSRRIDISKLVGSLFDTVKTTGAIFIIYLGSMFFVRFLTHSRLPYVFTDWLLALPLPAVGILMCVLLIFFILGMFIPPLALMMITIPVVFPTINALGYNPLHFGILVIKMIEMGMISPPVGINCFILAGIMPKEVSLDLVFRGSARFLVLDAFTLAILIAFPVLSLYLPGRM
jgi:C4-dicarboxylate transporter, DctM subunit